ncbi:MAG: hypothetical protein SVV67_08390 [Bacillota bacterium]|nr:hypothetical protein [Bacillota bacterium]
MGHVGKRKQGCQKPYQGGQKIKNRCKSVNPEIERQIAKANGKLLTTTSCQANLKR